jgi:hypothetical protein
VAAFVSAVISGAAGTYVLTLDGDADVGTDLVIEPGQNVIISGDLGLAKAPRWGTGDFAVQEHAKLSLRNLLLTESTSIYFNGVADKSTIHIASMQLSEAVLARTTQSLLSMNTQNDAGLEFLAVTIAGRSGPVTGTIVGSTSTPTGFLGLFSVNNGPCETSNGGKCVGRTYADRQLWQTNNDGVVEMCNIHVLAEGVLASCPAFDLVSYSTSGYSPHGGSFKARHDSVGLGGVPCGSYAGPLGGYTDPSPLAHCYTGSNCPPIGTTLAAGHNVTWDAGADDRPAYDPSSVGLGATFRGVSTNRGSAHLGWTLCFA